MPGVFYTTCAPIIPQFRVTADFQSLTVALAYILQLGNTVLAGWVINRSMEKNL